MVSVASVAIGNIINPTAKKTIPIPIIRIPPMFISPSSFFRLGSHSLIRFTF